jgi:hypothetical protein
VDTWVLRERQRAWSRKIAERFSVVRSPPAVAVTFLSDSESQLNQCPGDAENREGLDEGAQRPSREQENRGAIFRGSEPSPDIRF